MRTIVAFYAWQSDTPEKYNRHLIRKALDEAAGRITADASIDVEIVIDSDTEGLPGTPPITETILKKIEACEIFIPDVSFVACTKGDKLVPNPNVMTEYGYALSAKTHAALMPVMNTAFGPPEKLPFDMGHLRHPIQYRLESTAPDSERRETRAALSKKIEEKLRQQIAATQPPLPQPALFRAAEAKDGPARFREPDRPLGIRDGAGFIDAGAGKDIFFAAGAAMWLRLMPSFDPAKKWSSAVLRVALNSGINLPTLLGPASGTCVIRAEDGVGTCILSNDQEQKTDYVTFAFETGEVWAISTFPLRTHPSDLRVVDVERMLTEALLPYARFLTKLGINSPYKWIAGVTGVRGRELQYPVAPYRERIPGWGSHKCVSNEISSEGSYDMVQSPHSALLPFYKEIYDKGGLERPRHLPTT